MEGHQGRRQNGGHLQKIDLSKTLAIPLNLHRRHTDRREEPFSNLFK